MSKNVVTGLVVATAVVAVVLVVRHLTSETPAPAVAAKVGTSALGWPGLSSLWTRAKDRANLAAALRSGSNRSFVP